MLENGGSCAAIFVLCSKGTRKKIFHFLCGFGH